MSFKNLYLPFIWVYLVTGCITPTYDKQESAFIVFKTPTFQHADLGFIYENPAEIKVELYSSGQAVMDLNIKQNNICLSLFKCMSKEQFNEKVLSRHYPVNIIDNIFKGNNIFKGQNVHKMRNGFTQNIRKSNKYNIVYSVLNKQIIFRDTINNILIKVKRLK